MRYVKTYYKFSYVVLRFSFFTSGSWRSYEISPEQRTNKKEMKSWTVVQSRVGYTMPFVAKRKKKKHTESKNISL